MSVLDTILSDIETLWEGLTPVGTATPTYLRAHRSKGMAGNDEGHRHFWFDPDGLVAEQMMEFGVSITSRRYDFNAKLRIVPPGGATNDGGRDTITAFGYIVDEAHQLIDAVNTNTGWTPNNSFVQANGYNVERSPEGYIVTIDIEAALEEAV